MSDQFTAFELQELATSTKNYFILNITNPTYYDWLKSKGTVQQCYLDYINKNHSEPKLIDEKIDMIRNIIYAVIKPFSNQFFYWTLLLLILHKFNFRKPVMKIILAHYVLRSVGDILDQLGNLMGTYFHYEIDSNDHSFYCKNDGSVERFPLKWLVTRQIANIFWYTGEIAGDWYPLLRTRAVAREQKSIWFVYITCAMFNLSKIALIVLHFTLSPTKLYRADGVFNEEIVSNFYNTYWINQTCVIICSFIYDFAVFLVLKRQIFNKTKSDYGFLKKFRSISEYRIYISAFVGILGLPIILITLGFKFYYYYGKDMKSLNFSFEDLRLLISNLQYYMIFIDQIMLFRSRDDSSLGETTTSVTTAGGFSSNGYNKPMSANNFSSNQFIKPYNLDSKIFYSNLNNLNSGGTLTNSGISGINNNHFNYSNNNNGSFGRNIKASNYDYKW
ncbi:hypothetical protein BCR32DRAFT_282174 [Anaeromyces robustus]|uniref:Uncharacterized protein n=1 Tax=Anaeromyces robustus TaxID=1754192 RepID=A0A1Y1WZM4_9FUNG|nr:hypothetical protein BCR32DRAFT_282174 [Anaeromyces robustus]|eukprot:ORX78544.1 hypothetical protein BCR32DRAFT_282174 [Anaeromyces robustus]